MEEALKVRVTADTSQFSAAMNGARDKVRAFKADTDNLRIKAAWGDEMAKNAKKAGLSFNDIKQRIKATADAMGGTMAQATEAVGLQVDKLANNWGEAAAASRTAGASATVAGAETATAARTAGAALHSALGVIGMILAAIAAVIAAIKKIKEAHDAIVKKILEGAKKMAEVLYTVVKTVNVALIGAIKKAVEGVKALISKITSGDLDNLYNWAKTSGNAVADSMDRINSALINAKNGVAALLAPLVNSLAPVLDWIVDKFVSLVNVVSKFFAALGGKSTYISVKKAAVSYGDAAAGAMDNATDSAKAYKRELLGFDEINKLPAPDAGGSSGGSGGGSGGGGSAGSMFEEVSTGGESAGEIFKNFLDKVEAGLPKFDKALQNTATKINQWATNFYKVFGDTGIQKRVTDVTTKIATVLNKFVKSIDFNKIGKALGAGINTALNFLVTFVDKFNWKNLGKKLADFVNGVAKAINADNLGKLLVAPWNIAWKTLSGFINGLDWKTLANKVGGAINSALKNLSVKDFINTIEGAFKGVTIFIKNLTAKIDWDAMSDKLAKLGTGLANAIIKYLPDLTKNALQFASKFIAAIKDALSNEEMQGKIAKAAYLIVDGFMKLKEKYNEFKKIFDEAIFKALTGAFLAWYENSPLKNILEFLNPALKPAFDALKQSFEENGKTGGTTYTKGMKTATQNGLDTSAIKFEKFNTNMNSAAKAGKPFETIGTTISGQITGKTQSLIDKPAITFSKMGTKLTSLVAGVGEGAGSKLGNNIADKLQTKVNAPGTSFGKTGSSLIKAVGGVGEGAGATLGNNINNKVQAKVNDPGISFKNTGASLTSAVKKTGEGAGSVIGNNIVNAIKAKLNTDITVTGKIVGSGGGHYTFASGGYPSTGQLFLAREAGPELVGSIGGRTAVANNDQIVAAVSQGVASAVASVLGAGGGSTEVNVYMDSQRVAQAANAGNALMNRRFNVVVS